MLNRVENSRRLDRKSAKMLLCNPGFKGCNVNIRDSNVS